MHTRLEMVDRIRQFVLDKEVNSFQFGDLEILDRMEKAANTLWNNILAHKRANQILLKAQSPQRFLNRVDSYPMPDDSLRLERIEFRANEIKYAQLICGAAGSTDAPGFWELISDGSFRLISDDTIYEIRGVDFTAGVADMDAVAAVIQASIRAVTEGEEDVIWDTDHFEISVWNRIFFLQTIKTALPGTDLSQDTHMTGRRGSTATVDISPSKIEWIKMPFAPRHHPFHHHLTTGRHVSALNSGAAALFASPTHGHGLMRAYWKETAEGFIELSETPENVNAIFRIWYYKRPLFPQADDEKFSTPEDTDSLVEYLAAGLLSLEELEDRLPIGIFGQMYSAKLAEFLQGVGAGQITQSRRYVKIVR
jgi:hypothetical protein